MLLFVKFLHLAGFAGCLVASLLKNRIVRDESIGPRRLARLKRLDLIATGFAGLLVVSGLIMVFRLAQPAMVDFGDPVFWLRIVLFILASVGIVASGPVIRDGLAKGRMKITRRIRLIFAFELVAIAVVALIGRWIAGSLAEVWI